MHAHKTLSNEMLLLRKIAELEIGTCTLWFTKFLLSYAQILNAKSIYAQYLYQV